RGDSPERFGIGHSRIAQLRSDGNFPGRQGWRGKVFHSAAGQVSVWGENSAGRRSCAVEWTDQQGVGRTRRRAEGLTPSCKSLPRAHFPIGNGLLTVRERSDRSQPQ